MTKLQPLKKVWFILLVSFFLIPAFSSTMVEARLLSGSITERKLNKKIEKLLNLARKQYDSGKVQQAIETYWKILEIDPQETFAFLELGEIYFDLKIYDRAVELLEPGTKTAAMEMDPETVCHYFCVLTNTYLMTKEIGLASKALIKAAEASPKNPLPRKILGDIYLANNRIKSAYKAYKKALTFDPEYQPALEKIGELTTKYSIEISSIKEAKTPKPSAPKVQPRPQPVEPEEEIEEASSSEETNDADVAEDEEEESNSVAAAIEDRPMPLPVASPAKPEKPAPEEKKPMIAVQIPEAKKPETKAPATEQSENKTDDAPKADAATIEKQTDKLLAGTAEEKKDAASFFVGLGEQGIVEIEELLYDSDPEVRTIAIRTLGEFKANREKAITILHDSIDDPDPEVQKEIKNVLKSFE